MSMLMKKALSLLVGNTPKDRPLKKMTERQLIQLESEIGRELFGSVPSGHRREFFCLDKHTWVWHEEWKDVATGKKKDMTTRYEVHGNGVLKVQNGTQYHFIEGAELDNFYLCTKLYYESVMRGIYKRDPYTGQALSASPDTIE